MFLFQCSYGPNCGGNKDKNADKVREYALTYGQAGSTFQCHYNGGDPTKYTEVFRQRKVSEAGKYNLLVN